MHQCVTLARSLRQRKWPPCETIKKNGRRVYVRLLYGFSNTTMDGKSDGRRDDDDAARFRNALSFHFGFFTATQTTTTQPEKRGKTLWPLFRSAASQPVGRPKREPRNTHKVRLAHPFISLWRSWKCQRRSYVRSATGTASQPARANGVIDGRGGSENGLKWGHISLSIAPLLSPTHTRIYTYVRTNGTHAVLRLNPHCDFCDLTRTTK